MMRKLGCVAAAMALLANLVGCSPKPQEQIESMSEWAAQQPGVRSVDAKRFLGLWGTAGAVLSVETTDSDAARSFAESFRQRDAEEELDYAAAVAWSSGHGSSSVMVLDAPLPEEVWALADEPVPDGIQERRIGWGELPASRGKVREPQQVIEFVTNDLADAGQRVVGLPGYRIAVGNEQNWLMGADEDEARLRSSQLERMHGLGLVPKVAGVMLEFAEAEQVVQMATFFPDGPMWVGKHRDKLSVATGPHAQQFLGHLASVARTEGMSAQLTDERLTFEAPAHVCEGFLETLPTTALPLTVTCTEGERSWAVAGGAEEIRRISPQLKRVVDAGAESAYVGTAEVIVVLRADGTWERSLREFRSVGWTGTRVMHLRSGRTRVSFSTTPDGRAVEPRFSGDEDSGKRQRDMVAAWDASAS